MMRLIICIAIIGILSLSAYGATIHVPSDYPTIQKAINASSNGDYVVVADGLYQENIMYYGKRITVMSESANPRFCIIDGMKEGPCVSISGGISGCGCNIESVIQGFTITNGFALGGGIWAWGDGFTVRNCYFTGNGVPISDFNGISIFARVYDKWVVERCIFDGERGWSHKEKCAVVNIDGMFATSYSGWSIFRDNTIKDCVYNIDAAVSIWSCIVLVENNVFTGNSSHYGSPIYVRAGCAQIMNQVAIIRNNVMTGNIVDGPDWYIFMARGGGLFVSVDWQSRAWIVNNTIFGNYAHHSGSGIQCSYAFGGVINISNNILWGNETHFFGGDYSEISLQHLGTSRAILSCNVVEGGKGAIVDNEHGESEIYRLFTDNPCLVDPHKGDVHLLAMSPCIDRGMRGIWCSPVRDYEGDRRVYGKTIDIGADEYIY